MGSETAIAALPNVAIILIYLKKRGCNQLKIALMQPYFFPYIGYWQLMNAVDHYVIADDGHFRPKGWINRNKVLVSGDAHFITVPVHKSPSTLIKDIRIIDDGRFRKKIFRTICHSYSKAPYYDQCIDIIRNALNYHTDNLLEYLMNTICAIREYLEIDTMMSMSSQVARKSCTAQERIIEICNDFKADIYINAIGGMELYSSEVFGNAGINLRFLKTKEFQYRQFGEEFYPNLSIIDLMMFNAPEKIREYLSKYELI